MTNSPQKSPLSELNDFTYVHEQDEHDAYSRLAAFIREMRKEGISHRYIRDAAFHQAIGMCSSELVHPDKELLLHDLRYLGSTIYACVDMQQRLIRKYEKEFGEIPDHPEKP